MGPFYSIQVFTGNHGGFTNLQGKDGGPTAGRAALSKQLHTRGASSGFRCVPGGFQGRDEQHFCQEHGEIPQGTRSKSNLSTQFTRLVNLNNSLLTDTKYVGSITDNIPIWFEEAEEVTDVRIH